MATKAFLVPWRLAHVLEIEPGRAVTLRHSWFKEVRYRLGGVVAGVLAGAMFGWPWFVVPDELFLIGLLFGGIGAFLAVSIVAGALLRPVRRFDLEVRPDGLAVHRAPGVAPGHYPASLVRGIVSTVEDHELADELGPDEEPEIRGHGARQRLGIHIDGVGTVGVFRTNERPHFEQVAGAMQGTLEAGRDEPIPVWRVAPSAPGHPGPTVDAGGRPVGWPVHPHVGVEAGEASCAFTVPSPNTSRKWAAYALGSSPLIAVLAGMAALAFWGPGGSWNPFMVLADPDVLVLAIVGTWFAMGLYPAKRLVAWLHCRVAHGPYRIVVNEGELLVLGAGREVIDRVPVDQVLGFEVSRFGLEVLTPGKPVRLPVYALASREDRIWLQAGLVHALDRWSGRRLPELACCRAVNVPA